MSKLDSIRTKLDRKLFNTNVLGSTCTLYSYTEGTDSFGGYSDEDATYDAGTQHTIVPYNSIPNNLSIHSFGDFQEGDMYMVFRYDVPVKINDKVEFLSNTYFVKQVKDIPLNNGISAKITQLRKKH